MLDDLTKGGFLDKTDDYKMAVGTCYRCHTVVEPYLSVQWFVKMQPLAGPAIEAIKNEELVFHPDHWSKTYLYWMENIRDWCISRQLWWGHRIPVYYCQDCGEIVVARQRTGEVPQVRTRRNSSRIPMFSIPGFRHGSGRSRHSAGRRKLPNSRTFSRPRSLFTASEIIFLWVARMVMAVVRVHGQAAV